MYVPSNLTMGTGGSVTAVVYGVTNPTTAGSYTLSVRTTEDSSSAPSSLYTIDPAKPARITVAVSPASVTADAAAASTSVSVYGGVYDQYNNPVPTATVTLSASGNGFTFSSQQTTDSNGAFNVTMTPTTTAGTYTITATVYGTNVSNSATFTVTPGAPSSLRFSSPSSGSYVAPGQTISVTGVVYDAEGNGVPGQAVTFSDNSAGGSFAPNQAPTGAGGTFTVNYTAPSQACVPGRGGKVLGELRSFRLQPRP